MKNTQRYSWSLFVAVAGACTQPTTSVNSGPCGSGGTASQRTVAGEVGMYCAYAVAVNGFRCPLDRPNRFDIPRLDGAFTTVCSNLANAPIPAEACAMTSCAQATDQQVTECERALDAIYANRTCDAYSLCYSERFKTLCRATNAPLLTRYAQCMEADSPRPACTINGAACIEPIRAATWRTDLETARQAICQKCPGDQFEPDYCAPQPNSRHAIMTVFCAEQIATLTRCVNASNTCDGARACFQRMHNVDASACTTSP